MNERYASQEFEPKWQQRWDESGINQTRELTGAANEERPKWYFLTMLPYPSGDLHIGHWYAMAPSDAAARFKRMQGYNVFFPMGFDAFGLPAENAAIKRGIHPATWTMSNIEYMRKQLRSMGAMFAWDREAITCDPDYYKWTQWFFLRLHEAGLAYRAFAPVDFCPKCNTTLAREQVWGEDRHCERCGTPVIKKELNQWFFKITDYAEELLDFSRMQWPDRVQVLQTNWIGRSEGARVIFPAASGDPIEVFTTRPDTLWGATFMVLAPEHPLVDTLTTETQAAAVQAYRAQAGRQSDIDRMAADKDKTGVFTGGFATNPVNGERIPVWIADYVLMTYGTGAIMAVPAHDERDFAFAIKYGLPIIPVIARPDGLSKSVAWKDHVAADFAAALTAAGIAFVETDDAFQVSLTPAQVDAYLAVAQQAKTPGKWLDVAGSRTAFIFDDAVIELDSVAHDQEIVQRCQAIAPGRAGQATIAMHLLQDKAFYQDVLFHDAYHTMINSGAFSGTAGDAAKSKVSAWLEQQGVGKASVNYRLRDWLISRQRMWGAPIPMIHCEKCGVVPVPYADLPVRLPADAEFLPTGESPLKFHKGFRFVQCPTCGGPAERETDTMDTFMCSSWYQYAYVTPYHKRGQPIQRDDLPWDTAQGAYWLPVDQYTGGIEHATMHLMYTRFFTKALRDIGVVNFDEPMRRLFNQGTILGEDGEKMSKSRGNVVSPDDLVAKYGADVVRAYLMFIGPWDMGGPWNSRGIEGIQRFAHRIWSVVQAAPDTRTPAPGDMAELQRKTHQTIQRVTEDMAAFKFNTTLAALMEFNNYLIKARETAVFGSPAWREAIRSLILMLAPLMPYVSEELWERVGGAYSVHQQAWPAFDPEMAREDLITLVVQVNGKVRERIEVAADISEEGARTAALASDKVQKWLEGKPVRKVIYAPQKLVNIVI
ncbi:leucine--tRNA ligase [Candidatus Amarolinea aalborgensis]|uniref:leucine--tRNA ligase n=1 Tax=Candidatus Amarolinea aalborgensis TaxID=2249329 RepID=UPI003BF9DB4E